MVFEGEDIDSERMSSFEEHGTILSPHKRIEENSVFIEDSGANLNKIKELADDKIVELLEKGIIRPHQLESVLKDYYRAVYVRRKYIQQKIHKSREMPCQKDAQPEQEKAKDLFEDIPYENYDYAQVFNKCCENIVGYVSIPLGIVGPLKINGEDTYVPLSTTEGALIASTQRGCKVLNLCGGVSTIIYSDGMTRGPVVSLPSIEKVLALIQWIENTENFQQLDRIFRSTSRFGKLLSIKATPSGCDMYLRIKASTGDAMGMNMVSKGCEKIIQEIKLVFPEMKLASLSGNYCTDKKAACVNWIEGRGKSVIASAVIPSSLVEGILKTSIKEMIQVNHKKNLKGSAMAGSIGGFNAHAANMVTAIFIATGQDVAQTVVSSNCITELELLEDEKTCRMTCTMPSIEVGTVGGGTHLSVQSACLKLMDLAGSHLAEPGRNAKKLASIVCATVMAGELSLLAALSEGSLVKSHMSLNRGEHQIHIV